MPPLGSSFAATSAGMEEAAQRRKPAAQQALQTLSLELPKTLGAEQMAPSANVLGAFRPGSQDAASAQLSRMMRAMTSRAKVRKPVGPKNAAPARAPEAVPAKPPAMPTAAPKPGSIEDEDAPPRRGRPAKEAPEPGDPGYVGGGYVDSIPNPPQQMAPAAPPAQTAPPPTQSPAGPPPGSGAPPQYGGQGTPYNDANGGGSGGYTWDANRGMWVQSGFTRGA
jgi:hypothetical protein